MARTAKKPNRVNEGQHASLTYRPPAYFRVMRNGLYLLVGTAMAAVLYTVYWFYIATNLKDGVSNWVDERASQGIYASYKKIEISGFPGNFRVLLRQPKMRTAQLAAEAGGGKWSWSASKAVAEMAPWNFSKYNINLSGDHQLTYGSKSGTRQYGGKVGHLVLRSVIHDDGWPREATLNIKNLDLTEARSQAKISAKSAAVNARRLFAAESSQGDNAKSPTFAAEAQLADVQIPKYLNLPLGHRISQLVTEFKILGAAPELKTLAGLTQWRDQGGTVEVDVLETKYGPLYMRANGTLALDQAMQPMGAITAKFKGFFATIDTLKGARLIRSRDAVMAKVVLGALSKRPPGGGQPTISLPLSVQDGHLQAGPVPLMKLPPVDWTSLGFAPAKREQFKILR